MTQVQQDTIHKEANLISRLDRMPMNKSVMLLVGLLSWCWVMEAFDIGMIGQVVLVLKNLWHMDAGTIGILGSCSTAGVVIGTACAGFLTDRFGRKKILLWGVFIFTFFTLVGSAIADLWWIVSMRFIAGLGAGAVFPLPYLMISEIAPARHRGILVCICNAVLTAAYVLPTLCGSWAIRNFPLETAWRVPFIVGGIPIITIWFFHKYLPESPRWLMKRGRHEEVRRLVERLEKSAGVEHDDNFVDPQVLRNLQRTETDRSVGRAANWRMLFQPPYLSRSLVS